MTRQRVPAILAAVLLTSLIAQPAYANVGVPMLLLVWPGSWVALPVVVIVEAIVAEWLGISWRLSWKIAGLGNLATTAAGVPLTWFGLLLLQGLAALIGTAIFEVDAHVPAILIAILNAPWLPPFVEVSPWFVPVAAAWLCIPFFFASVWLEYRVGRRIAKEVDDRTLVRWSWRANALTYGSMILGLLGWAFDLWRSA